MLMEIKDLIRGIKFLYTYIQVTQEVSRLNLTASLNLGLG